MRRGFAQRSSRILLSAIRSILLAVMPLSALWCAQKEKHGSLQRAHQEFRLANEHRQGKVKEGSMTGPVRYQKGHLYQDHGAWFVRYRECVKDQDGNIVRHKRTQRLGSIE